MEDIGKAAGLSKGTLYLYFKDKDALIRAILDTIFSMEMGDWHAAFSQEGTVVQKLNTFLELYIAESEEIAPALPIMYEFFGMSLRRADVQVVLREQYLLSVSILEAVIQLGIERGELRPLNARQVAITFMSMLDGTALQLAYGVTLDEINAHLHDSMQLLLESILAA
jgi:AcrR family transcriptional regulator